MFSINKSKSLSSIVVISFLLLLFQCFIPGSMGMAWYKTRNIDYPTKCTVGYTVNKGDTCESIAEKFKIDKWDFIRMNNFPCEDLRKADKVCITGTYVECAEEVLVLKGTTCSRFMNEQKMSAQEFKKLNPKVKCDNLFYEPYLFFCIKGELRNVQHSLRK